LKTKTTIKRAACGRQVEAVVGRAINKPALFYNDISFAQKDMYWFLVFRLANCFALIQSIDM
jgi:hypothetical protein